MTTYASFERKTSPLASDFAIEMAGRWFLQSVLDKLPRYKRGPKKGTPKGWLIWDKCTSGGWKRAEFGGDLGYGGVIYPRTTHNVRIEIDFKVVARSHGRVDR